jgi:hypothetical protein
MLTFFGDSNGLANSYQARTKEDLEDVLELPEFKDPKGVQVSEYRLKLIQYFVK